MSDPLLNHPRQSDDHYQLSGNNKIFAGALLTIVVLIFQSYFSKSPIELDIYQQWSLIAIAIAIPGLGFWWFLSHESEGLKLPKKYSDSLVAILLLSALSALIVIGLTIWRYFSPAGIVFVIVTVLLIIYLTITVILEYKS